MTALKDLYLEDEETETMNKLSTIRKVDFVIKWVMPIAFIVIAFLSLGTGFILGSIASEQLSTFENIESGVDWVSVHNMWELSIAFGKLCIVNLLLFLTQIVIVIPLWRTSAIYPEALETKIRNSKKLKEKEKFN